MNIKTYLAVLLQLVLSEIHAVSTEPYDVSAQSVACLQCVPVNGIKKEGRGYIYDKPRIPFDDGINLQTLSEPSKYVKNSQFVFGVGQSSPTSLPIPKTTTTYPSTLLMDVPKSVKTPSSTGNLYQEQPVSVQSNDKGHGILAHSEQFSTTSRIPEALKITSVFANKERITKYSSHHSKLSVQTTLTSKPTIFPNFPTQDLSFGKISVIQGITINKLNQVSNNLRPYGQANVQRQSLGLTETNFYTPAISEYTTTKSTSFEPTKPNQRVLISNKISSRKALSDFSKPNFTIPASIKTLPNFPIISSKIPHPTEPSLTNFIHSNPNSSIRDFELHKSPGSSGQQKTPEKHILTYPKFSLQTPSPSIDFKYFGPEGPSRTSNTKVSIAPIANQQYSPSHLLGPSKPIYIAGPSLNSFIKSSVQQSTGYIYNTPKTLFVERTTGRSSIGSQAPEQHIVRPNQTFQPSIPFTQTQTSKPFRTFSPTIRAIQSQTSTLGTLPQFRITQPSISLIQSQTLRPHSTFDTFQSSTPSTQLQTVTPRIQLPFQSAIGSVKAQTPKSISTASKAPLPPLRNTTISNNDHPFNTGSIISSNNSSFPKFSSQTSSLSSDLVYSRTSSPTIESIKLPTVRYVDPQTTKSFSTSSTLSPLNVFQSIEVTIPSILPLQTSYVTQPIGYVYNTPRTPFIGDKKNKPLTRPSISTEPLLFESRTQKPFQTLHSINMQPFQISTPFIKSHTVKPQTQIPIQTTKPSFSSMQIPISKPGPRVPFQSFQPLIPSIDSHTMNQGTQPAVQTFRPSISSIQSQTYKPISTFKTFRQPTGYIYSTPQTPLIDTKKKQLLDVKSKIPQPPSQLPFQPFRTSISSKETQTVKPGTRPLPSHFQPSIPFMQPPTLKQGAQTPYHPSFPSPEAQTKKSLPQIPFGTTEQTIFSIQSQTSKPSSELRFQQSIPSMEFNTVEPQTHIPIRTYPPSTPLRQQLPFQPLIPSIQSQTLKPIRKFPSTQPTGYVYNTPKTPFVEGTTKKPLSETYVPSKISKPNHQLPFKSFQPSVVKSRNQQPFRISQPSAHSIRLQTSKPGHHLPFQTFPASTKPIEYIFSTSRTPLVEDTVKKNRLPTQFHQSSPSLQSQITKPEIQIPIRTFLPSVSPLQSQTLKPGPQSQFLPLFPAIESQTSKPISQQSFRSFQPSIASVSEQVKLGTRPPLQSSISSTQLKTSTLIHAFQSSFPPIKSQTSKPVSQIPFGKFQSTSEPVRSSSPGSLSLYQIFQSNQLTTVGDIQYKFPKKFETFPVKPQSRLKPLLIGSKTNSNGYVYPKPVVPFNNFTTKTPFPSSKQNRTPIFESSTRAPIPYITSQIPTKFFTTPQPLLAVRATLTPSTYKPLTTGTLLPSKKPLPQFSKFPSQNLLPRIDVTYSGPLGKTSQLNKSSSNRNVQPQTEPFIKIAHPPFATVKTINSSYGYKPFTTEKPSSQYPLSLFSSTKNVNAYEPFVPISTQRPQPLIVFQTLHPFLSKNPTSRQPATYLPPTENNFRHSSEDGRLKTTNTHKLLTSKTSSPSIDLIYAGPTSPTFESNTPSPKSYEQPQTSKPIFTTQQPLLSTLGIKKNTDIYKPPITGTTELSDKPSKVSFPSLQSQTPPRPFDVRYSRPPSPRIELSISSPVQIQTPKPFFAHLPLNGSNHPYTSLPSFVGSKTSYLYKPITPISSQRPQFSNPSISYQPSRLVNSQTTDRTAPSRQPATYIPPSHRPTTSLKLNPIVTQKQTKEVPPFVGSSVVPTVSSSFQTIPTFKHSQFNPSFSDLTTPIPQISDSRNMPSSEKSPFNDFKPFPGIPSSIYNNAQKPFALNPFPSNIPISKPPSIGSLSPVTAPTVPSQPESIPTSTYHSRQYGPSGKPQYYYSSPKLVPSRIPLDTVEVSKPLPFKTVQTLKPFNYGPLSLKQTPTRHTTQRSVLSSVSVPILFSKFTKESPLISSSTSRPFSRTHSHQYPNKSSFEQPNLYTLTTSTPPLSVKSLSNIPSSHFGTSESYVLSFTPTSTPRPGSQTFSSDRQYLPPKSEGYFYPQPSVRFDS